jgi:phenylacetate-coenzyme A ligase PaaK-like adenylate-forming protein
MGADPNAVLLQEPTFGAGPGEMFDVAMTHAVRRLRLLFPKYDQFLLARGVEPDTEFRTPDDLARLPAIFLPVLKSYPFEVPAGLKIVRTLTSSGTTGKPSLTPLDELSWQYRVAAMRQSYAAMGLLDGDATALCFLMDPTTTQMAGSVVIDAVLRSVPGVKAVHYLARMTPTGPQFLAEQAAGLFAEAMSRGPVVLVGYPALMAAAMQMMTNAGRTSLPLPPGSRILTGGGWKSFLPGLTLDRDQFRTQAATFFGIPPTSVRDMYGLSECPAVFVECEHGRFHVPAWCRAEAIDPETNRPRPDGEEGLLQLTCPLTVSYPLVKVTTTDKAALGRGCACGRVAPYLVPKGRVTAARFETCAMKIGQAVG